MTVPRPAPGYTQAAPQGTLAPRQAIAQVPAGTAPMGAAPPASPPGPGEAGPAPATGAGAAGNRSENPSAEGQQQSEARTEGNEPSYGPKPLTSIHILQNYLRGLCGKDPIKDPPPKKKEEKKDEGACGTSDSDAKDGASKKKDDGATGTPAPDAGSCPSKDAASKKKDDGADTTSAPDAACSAADALKCMEQSKDPCIHINGWMDFDYTYRSTGPGQNNVAPVMNRFGDEFLTRELGLYVFKPIDPKEWSWGFNIIFIAGADASFLQPTAGYPAQTNPRFGESFTDLNLTAHLPILTEGGVDIKAGRQTTVLGPMGALPWQRYFNSSDYAWYNLEEGRYTGVSAVWHVNKQFDWYNGVEIGGWGVFFDDPVHGVDYITQFSYWLDEDAKKTKVWLTVLTGPTGHFDRGGNSTTVEVGLQHNWSKCVYQIVDFQMDYSKAPIFSPPPPGYQERAYDVYTYLGYHLNKCWDLNSRFEWYKDVDGGGYPGGFGVPHTDYFAVTLGPDYHPTDWLQFRPEIRYDYATHDNFGEFNDKKNQLSIGGDVLIKF